VREELVSELMARFLNEALAKSAAHLHSQMLAPVQPAQESSPTPHEAPTQPVTSSKRGQGHPVVYHDHSLANQVQMALTAQVRGPCWVARNSVLWGYDEPLAKQTISTWQKQLPRLLAKASGNAVPRVCTAPHPRAVSKEAKDGVLHALALSAVDGEETTTEAVCEMFAAQGVTPSTSFVRSFLHNNNQSLHTVIPRSSYAIDDSNQVEGQIQTLWPTFAPSICPGSAGSL